VKNLLGVGVPAFERLAIEKRSKALFRSATRDVGERNVIEQSCS
jgi:hypothetical protein